MKKFFMMAAVCFACLTASAQAEVGSISIMPKVGVNFANVTEGDGDMKIGLVAGAEAEYQFAEKLSFTGGLLYSMQGSKGEGDDLKMDYINIPILANYEVIPGLKVKAGVQPAFLMSAKVGDFDIKDACKSFDLAIPVGASYQISDFVIDARYNFGLSGIYDGDGDGKNSVIQLTVGYKFAL